MNKITKLLDKYEKQVVAQYYFVSIFLLLIWLPGLGATIMMSDSFVINYPRLDYLLLLFFVWFLIPLTIFASFIYLRFKKKVFVYLTPLVNFLLFVTLMLVFPLLYGDMRNQVGISEEEQKDLNLIINGSKNK